MTEKTKLLFNRLESIGFLLYFIILTVERLLALIFSVNGGDEYALLSGNIFNYFAYGVTALSLAMGVGLALRPGVCVKMCESLFTGNLYDFEKNMFPLATAVTVLLFGGMMHTGYTLAGVQFASYGFLIAAMIVRAVEMCLAGGDKYLTVVSVIYLTLFSMTIPVAYISFLKMPLLAIFFSVEFLAVFLLVPTFGYMLYCFMKEGVTSFSPILLGAMLLLSGATVALKWTEEVNMFVLIFVGLTLVFYLAFGIVAFRRSGKLPKIENEESEKWTS